MKLQTRKRIFYVFLLLFIVIGTVVVLYAEGWRIDFATMEAKKAGGIYIRSYPENASSVQRSYPGALSASWYRFGKRPETNVPGLRNPDWFWISLPFRVIDAFSG